MADRTLELRISGHLAGLLDEVSASEKLPTFTVARKALEIGLRSMQDKACPPQPDQTA